MSNIEKGNCRYAKKGYCGYSQETMDALTKERDGLQSLCDQLAKIVDDYYFSRHDPYYEKRYTVDEIEQSITEYRQYKAKNGNSK